MYLVISVGEWIHIMASWRWLVRVQSCVRSVPFVVLCSCAAACRLTVIQVCL